jgi:regulator of protease activity HflC (stomatin/prohibitin superfamily)
MFPFQLKPQQGDMIVEYFKYPVFTNMFPFTLAATEGSPVDEAFYFQTREGIKCNADIGIQCKADPAKVNVLFNTYRESMSFIIKTYLRAEVRDAFNRNASSMTVDSLYSMGKIALINKVQNDVMGKFANTGLIIENITYLSDIRFPEAIQQGIVDKMAASQRAMQRENELREARAMAEKKIIEAKAEAEANRAKNTSITAQLIEWERLQIQKDFITKWNGSSVPQYMGANSNFNLLFNAGK